MLSVGQNGRDKVAWFENDGSQSFTENTISTSFSVPFDIVAADVDKDGDIDVLLASLNDNKIAWFKNDGATDPSFTAYTITSDANVTGAVFAIDVDGDGDIDVLSASEGDDKIAWYENSLIH